MRVGWLIVASLSVICLIGTARVSVRADEASDANALELVSRMEIAAGLLEPYLNAALVIEALIAVLVIGPLSSLYPAWRATRLVPADALRTV